MTEYIVVDRITGEIAVCEEPNRTMREIPLALLPPQVSEGDCLYISEGVYYIDKDETLRRREQNVQRLKRLLKRKKEQ